MLNFNDVSLRRGTRELLTGVTAVIQNGQKVGITGANGVGKSSLFKLIMNELQPDAGRVSLPPDTVIAHVEQETPAVDKSAIDYVMDGDKDLRALEQQIEQAQAAQQGEHLAHLYSEMESIAGYSARSRAARLMSGLGFKTDQENVAVKQFSGGWRVRLNLAQALMCRSDLLLLDEPTNHLDLDAVMWLEDWLNQYGGTLLLISHDRDFLDQITTHIGHIENQTLTLYTGNYSAFEVRRAEKLAGQQAAFEKQQRELARIHQFVSRFRAKATKARQVQSRLKALEKMELISQAHVDSPFQFQLLPPDRMPNPLIQLEEASVGYGDTEIIKDIGLSIVPGQRIGLLGHNGAGKSTFVKMLAGELPLLKGERLEAKELNVGYFAQHQLEQLDAEASPLLHLQRIDPVATDQSLRNFLGGFAFQGDMATEPVAPLSGGEKARLVLAMIVYQKPNFLLLDEPTNHLDLEMRQALCTALQDYEGAMIIVSHDRHLLRTTTDTLLLVDNGRVSPFEGDLDDYRRWLQSSAAAEEKPKESKSAAVNKKQQRREAAASRRQLQPLRNQIKKHEQKIASLNDELAALETRLADPTIYDEHNKSKLLELLESQTKIQQQLNDHEQQWLEAAETLEALQGE